MIQKICQCIGICIQPKYPTNEMRFPRVPLGYRNANCAPSTPFGTTRTLALSIMFRIADASSSETAITDRARLHTRRSPYCIFRTSQYNSGRRKRWKSLLHTLCKLHALYYVLLLPERVGAWQTRPNVSRLKVNKIIRITR